MTGKEYASQVNLDLKNLLLQLCRIPSPSNNEEKRSRFCENWLKEKGAESTFIDETGNVIFPYHCDKYEKIIVIMAHMDTVFPDLEPFEPKEVDGKLYCPAVGDDTANLAQLMILASTFITNKFDIGYGIVFVCGTGEEGLGNLKGSRAVVNRYQLRIKYFIALDMGFNSIVNKAVGSNRYNIEIKTEGGHSFLDFGKRNANLVLAELITEIYKLDVSYYEGKTTYNVGVIGGGNSINSISSKSFLFVEFRSDNEKSLNLITQSFDSIINRAQEIENQLITVELIGNRPCGNALLDNNSGQKNLENIVKSTIEKFGGIVPEYRSGSTDCNIPFSKGIPAVCFGGCLGHGAHTREEWIDLNSLIKGSEIIYEIIFSII